MPKAQRGTIMRRASRCGRDHCPGSVSGCASVWMTTGMPAAKPVAAAIIMVGEKSQMAITSKPEPMSAGTIPGFR
jgi:hypothetical protein